MTGLDVVFVVVEAVLNAIVAAAIIVDFVLVVDVDVREAADVNRGNKRFLNRFPTEKQEKDTKLKHTTEVGGRGIKREKKRRR